MLLGLGKKITNFYFLFLFPLFFPDVIQGHPKTSKALQSTPKDTNIQQDPTLPLLKLGLIGFVLHNSSHLIVRCNSLYLLRLKRFWHFGNWVCFA
jgi:hypothetical protein